MSAILESGEGVFLRHHIGNHVHLGEHIHRLRLDDGHQHGNAAGLQVLDGRLHRVQPRLVHKGDETHTDDHHLSVLRDGVHHLLEFGDGAEEDRAVQALDVNLAADFIGQHLFVFPWDLFVESGDLVEVVAALHEVAGAFHEQHAGNHHSDANGDEQIDENGEEQHGKEHHRIGTRDFQQVFESLEINDADTDRDEDTGQHGEGDEFHQAAEAEQDGQQEEAMNHARKPRTPAAIDIDHRTHRGTGTRKSAENTDRDIADTLSDKFLIAIMFRLGRIVGHHGGEQRVDGAEACQRERRNHRHLDDRQPFNAANLVPDKEGHRETGRNLTDGEFRVEMDENSHHRHHDESDQRGGYLLGNEWEKVDDGHGAQAEQERRHVQAADFGRQLRNHIHNQHWRLHPQQRINLLHDNDDANTAHKAGKDGIGDIADVLADFEDAEQDLEQAAEDGGEGHAHDDSFDAVGLAGGPDGGDEGCRNHRHRAGGAADLGGGAAEKGGEEAEHHCARQAGQGTDGADIADFLHTDHAKRLNTEGQSQRQGHNTGGQSAKNITF